MANNIPIREPSLMTAPSEAVEMYCVKRKDRTASHDIEAATIRAPPPPKSGAVPSSKFNPPFVAGRHISATFRPYRE